MKTLKLLSLAAVLLLILSLKSFAQEGDDKVVVRATESSDGMKKRFKLSDEQYKSVYDLFVSTIQKENALWKSGKSRLDMEAGKDQIRQDFVGGIKKIFTEKQFAKFDKPQTLKGIKTGAKFRAAKMKKELGLTKKQTKAVYNLMVSTGKKQNELVKPEGDKTQYYNERIKLDDEFYAGIKGILTEEQMKDFNKNKY
ncbi:MAG: hypothetical protein JSS63_02315 [Bacteroidetes bacterium]|nr:hypothetical protein [Bacteroidota bacterium]